MAVTIVRRRIIRALPKFAQEDGSVVPLLIEELKNKDAEIRREVANMLGVIGYESPAAKGALPALERLKKDEDERVRDIAARAIKHINSPNYPKKAP